MVSAESALCTLLALYTLVWHPSFYSLSVFCGALLTLFYPSPTNRQSHLWAARIRTYDDDDDQGCCMSTVLIPLLFFSMSLHNAKWTIYAEMASFAWIPLGSDRRDGRSLLHTMIDTGANEQVSVDHLCIQRTLSIYKYLFLVAQSLYKWRVADCHEPRYGRRDGIQLRD